MSRTHCNIAPFKQFGYCQFHCSRFRQQSASGHRCSYFFLLGYTILHNCLWWFSFWGPTSTMPKAKAKTIGWNQFLLGEIVSNINTCREHCSMVFVGLWHSWSIACACPIGAFHTGNVLVESLYIVAVLISALAHYLMVKPDYVSNHAWTYPGTQPAFWARSPAIGGAKTKRVHARIQHDELKSASLVVSKSQRRNTVNWPF